jgi:pyruvyltransferase
MRVFRANYYNVGDSLPGPIVSHFLNIKVKEVGKRHKHKLMVIGSEMQAAKPGDVVWGQGIRRLKHYELKGVKVLAVRGKLVEQYISGVKIPKVYGDPGLLMPLMYQPEVEKRYKLGIIPHWSERYVHPDIGHLIPVTLRWEDFVQEILSCERIISSSLHGIVLSEAYGIPTEWACWGNTSKWLIKYQDYLTGTDREIQDPGELPPITNLKEIQLRLIKSLYEYYKKSFRKNRLNILSTLTR